MSTATRSVEANIPMSGTMGRSLAPKQSQPGVTSMAITKWATFSGEKVERTPRGLTGAALDDLAFLPPGDSQCASLAPRETVAAAHAELLVETNLASLEGKGIARAQAEAPAAKNAPAGIEHGVNSLAVKTQLSLPSDAAHAQVLECGTQGELRVEREVGEVDEDIGIIYGLGNSTRQYLFGIRDLDLDATAAQAVGDEDRAAQGLTGEAVVRGGIKMGEEIVALMSVQGEGIGGVRKAASLPYEVSQSTSKGGPYIPHVACFPEVQFDRYVVALGYSLLRNHLAEKSVDGAVGIAFLPTTGR